MTRPTLVDRTHCKHGHPITPESSYFDSRGYFVCRTCLRDRQHRRTRVQSKPPAPATPEERALPHRFHAVELPEHRQHLRGRAAVAYVYWRHYAKTMQEPTLILAIPENVYQYRECTVRVANSSLEPEPNEILFWVR